VKEGNSRDGVKGRNAGSGPVGVARNFIGTFQEATMLRGKGTPERKNTQEKTGESNAVKPAKPILGQVKKNDQKKQANRIPMKRQ